MASVLPPHPWQGLWFLDGCLDFPCSDAIGGAVLSEGAFLGWNGLSPWHFGHQCPVLLYMEQWKSYVGSLLCWLGAVVCSWDSPWRIRWCVTIAIVAGVGHMSLVLADCIHRFGAVGDLFPGMLNGKVVHCNVSQLTGGCLEWLCHKFPKELSLMAVCTDDTAMQFMLAVLIIDHLAVVHQCLDVCGEI